MNILILGGGGREHALAWAVSAEPEMRPADRGPRQCRDRRRSRNAPRCRSPMAVRWPQFCAENGIDFVIVGPEAPLVAGRGRPAAREAGLAGLRPVGRGGAARKFQGLRARDLRGRFAPGAAWARFDTADAARAHIRAARPPIVVKADGLAAGKGG
jgi:phosphoribosylamine--glycine ligase